MLKILFAEDDLQLNEIVSNYLKKAGFEVIAVTNGLDALDQLYQNKVDIVISDIMMPLCDGLTLLKSIREENLNIPIIFTSARDDKATKQMSYRLGIDDYLVKPFDLEELVFKINAMARRIRINNSHLLTIGNFKMDALEHMAYLNNNEVELTVREFDILYKMLSYPKKTFTRSNLMEEFWGFDSSASSRTVDVLLSKLREKLKDCDAFTIKTVHGLGYKVVINEEDI